MKIDRLIGIITVLLRNEKVTAPYLAEKFEVSRRTINRDIEDICRAGIPVVTTQGYDGGISIAEGYKIDKSVFTSEELKAILIGLKGMDSVSSTSYAARVTDKLSSGGGDIHTLADNIMIDLSTHYKNALAPKIEDLRSAISDQHCVCFRYFYNKGESERIIEPYLLLFRWASWYVFGYCLKRQDFRMFKLNRIVDLRILHDVFQRRQIPEAKLDFEQFYNSEKQFTVLFDESVKYRLVEEYGADSFTEAEDGRLLFSFYYTNEDEIVQWLLSFGGSAEICEPPHLREHVLQEVERILKRYGK